MQLRLQKQIQRARDSVKKIEKTAEGYLAGIKKV